mmetsp:Transcript_77398/g.151863  ORF Transcript_77398/g.151863 Transcript_77398/m.151863 type:complete len:109 (-) Transcript_77398:44-370(-)
MTDGHFAVRLAERLAWGVFLVSRLSTLVLLLRLPRPRRCFLPKRYARHNGLMFLSKENTRRLRSPPRARVDFFAERIMQFTSTVSAVPTASAVPVVGLSKTEAVLSGL